MIYMMTNEEIYNGLINQCKECKANHTDDCDDCKIPLVMVAVFKQIPKKPVIDMYRHRMECPTCEMSMPWFQQKDGSISGTNYCQYCGQRLDWRMDDD